MVDVFVSHTSELSEFPPGERSFVGVVATVIAALSGVDMIEQEASFSAESAVPKDMCEGRVEECDVFVGLIGWRFGSRVAGDDGGRSFVEYELDYAGQVGKPRLVFVWEPDSIPTEFAIADGFEFQKAFRGRLASGQELAFRTFEGPADLASEVREALRNQVGVGATAEGGLEPVWCGRVPRVPAVFGGGEAPLNALEANESLLVAVTGQGGIGKTTLAAALAERSRNDYEVIWWARAEDPAVLVGDVIELASRVGVAVDGDEQATLAALVEWYETTPRRWLVFFDNATTPDSIASYLPKRGNGRVVITTRNQKMRRVAEPFDVTVWDEQESATFLAKRVRSSTAVAADDPALEAVAGRLGGLALALEQAAAWVLDSPLNTYADYLELLDTKIAEAFAADTLPAGYDQTAWATWRISLDAANTKTPVAGRLLAMAAHLGPELIPIDWLEPQDPYLDTDTDEVRAALTALHNQSLITLTPTHFSLHRLIAAAARHNAPPEAATAAVDMLRAQTGDTNVPDNWPTLATLAPHTSAAIDHLVPADSDVAEDLWWVLDDVARYEIQRGQLTAAIELASQALAFAEQHLDPDDANILTSRDTLAAAYTEAGAYPEAIELVEANLADRQRVQGPDHPDTLISRNNLASTHARAGDYTKAIELHEATLADRERVLGPDDPDTLVSRNNLAYAYAEAGDYTKAIELHEATLADRERVLGPDDPDTLFSRSNLAAVYGEGGDYTKAIELGKANVADSERILGPDHPHTLSSRSNLAYTYADAGDRTRARDIFEQLIVDAERALSANHPYLEAIRDGLAALNADFDDPPS